MFKFKPALLAILLALLLIGCQTTVPVSNESNAQIDNTGELNDFFIVPSSKMRIAVLPVKTDYINNNESEAIRLHLEEKILSIPNYSLIDNNNLSEIMDQQNRNLTGLYDEEYAIEIAKLVYANNIVFPTITKLNNIFVFNLKIIDVESGEILRTRNFHFSSKDELISSFIPGYKTEEITDQSDENKIELVNIEDYSKPIEFNSINLDGVAEEWTNVGFQPINKNNYIEKWAIAKDTENIYLLLTPYKENQYEFNRMSLNFLITPEKDFGYGSFHFAVHIESGVYAQLSLRQYKVEYNDNNEPINTFWNELPNYLGRYDQIIEMSIPIKWLPNRSHLYIEMQAYNETVNPAKTLWNSEQYLFNLN